MTTNGHVITAEGECPRCPDKGFDTLPALAEHYVRVHEMTFAEAIADATRAFKGAATVPEVVRHEVPHHRCPGCRAKIPCPWEMIAQIKQQARRLDILAANMERKQMGLPVGAPRKNATWTDADVVSAYKSGLSIKAIAGMYRAGQSTVARALTRAGAK